MKRFVAGTCVFFAVFAAILLSQNTASIVGIVSDAIGAVVANVKVEAKSTSTGVVYTALTDANGAFTLASLPPGEYEVKVSTQGFKTLSRTVTVLTAQIMRLDIPLQPGSTAETVTVTAESTLLRSESGDLAHSVIPGTMSELPMLGVNPGNGYRVPIAMAQLIPGVQYQSGAGVQPHFGGPPDIHRGYGIHQPYGPSNTAQYDYYVENEFAAAKSNPLSTFVVDVDTASYTNVRRFLNEGQLPPVSAVRIE